MNRFLDLDVLSQLATKQGNPKVVSRLEQEKKHCYAISIVNARLACYFRTKEGKHRFALQDWLEHLTGALQGRIHGFNDFVAHVWADQQWDLENAGKRMLVEGSTIAATARRYNLIIVTGNEKNLGVWA